MNYRLFYRWPHSFFPFKANVFEKLPFKLFSDILASISFFKFLHNSVFCCASYPHHEKGEGKHHGYTCAYSRHHRRAELRYGRPVPVRSHRQHFRRHEHRRIAHHLYDRGPGRNLGHLHPVPPRWHPSFRRERITAETKTGFRADWRKPVFVSSYSASSANART